MGRRPERLAEGLREEIARLVAEDLKDPRLGFVTITRVEMSGDLTHARVHVGVLGNEAERQKGLAALQGAAGFVRRELGRRMRLRLVPEIEFRYDKGLDAADRVARLLQEDKAATAAAAAAADDGEPEPEE